jgi:hypothetical protein
VEDNPAVRPSWLAALVLAAVPVLVMPAHAGITPPGVEKVLQQDWCAPGSYDAARRAAGSHLSGNARRNLDESEQTAHRYPRGCVLAERAAGRKNERIRLHAPWIRGGCAVGPLPLGRGWRHRTALAAAASWARSERPVLTGRPVVTDRGTRSGAVTGPCGQAAARRSATVSLALTALYPSASASLSILVVARFPHYGWRVWAILH